MDFAGLDAAHLLAGDLPVDHRPFALGTEISCQLFLLLDPLLCCAGADFAGAGVFIYYDFLFPAAVQPDPCMHGGAVRFVFAVLRTGPGTGI